MSTLDWIGKRAVLNHHRHVPTRLLVTDTSLSCNAGVGENLIVQGDNLEALKALLPRFAGRVKCIYIDPPYNTGVDERDDSGKRSGWIYDDNVESPEIKQWLHKVVGDEAQDLSRHDKWLCMMYPRLELLRQFLTRDGVVFVSIDDIEIGSLRLVLDEIFGIPNRVGTIVWKNATDNNPTNIAMEHEYVLCYARDRRRLPSEWKAESLAVKTRLQEVGDDFVARYDSDRERQQAYTQWFRENRTQLWPFEDYKFIDAAGIYTGMRAVHNPGKEGYRYDVMHPGTGRPCQQPLMGYRFPFETMRALINNGRIIFGPDETKIVELKVYAKDYRAKLSSVFELDGRVGTNELKAIFPERTRPFDFPKPTGLIAELLSFATAGNDIVLDSFAGSGTTGHAAMVLNASDGHQRTFILIEMKTEIAETVTAERLRRVITGYTNARGETVTGLGGGFQFSRLGQEILDESGLIGKGVSFDDLAQLIFLSETSVPLGVKPTCSMLGTHGGRTVYLLFSPEDGQNPDKDVFDGRALAALPKAVGNVRVVYARQCRISADRLDRERIVFKQIPYALNVGP